MPKYLKQKKWQNMHNERLDKGYVEIGPKFTMNKGDLIQSCLVKFGLKMEWAVHYEWIS